MKTIKIGRQVRAARIERTAVNVEARTVEIAFSSESPVGRWFGTEILGHAANEVNLDWLSGGTAPLLVDHNTRQQVGVVEKAWIGNDRIGRALVRYGNSPLADQEFKDVAEGIRSNISVGYQIDELQLVEAQGEPNESAEDTYRAVKWTPLEISTVAIPADMSVGVGREGEVEMREIPVINHIEKRTKPMSIEPNPPVVVQPAVVAVPAGPSPDEIIKTERARIADIDALGARHNVAQLAREHIAKGTSIELFRGILLEQLPAGKPLETSGADLGMSEREAKQFSFVRMIEAQVLSRMGGKPARELAPFEAEASAAVEKNLGKAPRGFYVPLDAQRVKMAPSQRDLVVGTSSAGGYAVATELRPQDFIELLRNQMMVRSMGARVLTGLQGNVAFPKQSAAGTAYWVAESGTATESSQTFGQVTMAPKTLAAFTDISRLLLKQSSIDIENFVRSDLSQILALAADLAALHGTGSSNQPTGIAATSGIGSVAGGTNGLAPTWAHIVALESALTTANAAIGSTGYLVNAATRGKLKSTDKTSGGYGQFIWPDMPLNNGMGTMNGYMVGTSNQVSSTLTKGSTSGSCSAIFFGNWSDLIIGEWGVLDILVNPYTGATAGDVRVHTFMSMDIAVRKAASFAAMLDAITT